MDALLGVGIRVNSVDPAVRRRFPV